MQYGTQIDLKQKRHVFSTSTCMRIAFFRKTRFISALQQVVRKPLTRFGSTALPDFALRMPTYLTPRHTVLHSFLMAES